VAAIASGLTLGGFLRQALFEASLLCLIWHLRRAFALIWGPLSFAVRVDKEAMASGQFGETR